MQPFSFHDSTALRFDCTANTFDSVPFRNLSWSIDDAGTLYGAILVERFRTYGGKLLDLSDYRARLEFGAQQFAITLPDEVADLEKIANRLLEVNASMVQGRGDVSVVTLVSPGVPSEYPFGTRPTCMMYLSELPFARLHDWYENGTDLLLGKCNVVPSSCWSSQVKSRSRLPYFLSDSAVSEKPNSLALLTTTRGTVADTSVANILMIDRSGQIVSPPKEDILIGCTLKALDRILNSQGITITYREIHPSEFYEASEVLLTGSSGGIWFVRSIDGRPIGLGQGSKSYDRLKLLWREYVGIDYVAQAANLA